MLNKKISSPCGSPISSDKRWNVDRGTTITRWQNSICAWRIWMPYSPRHRSVNNDTESDTNLTHTRPADATVSARQCRHLANKFEVGHRSSDRSSNLCRHLAKALELRKLQVPLPQPTLVWGRRSERSRRNFWMKLILQKLEGWSYTVRWKLHDPNFNRFWLIHPCDGQTDRKTDLR